MTVLRKTGAVVLTGAVGLTGAVLAPPASAELPPGSIVHRSSQFWSWSGPRAWVSVDSSQGISIDGGDRGIDYGFSSILCSPGNSVAESVAAYFSAQTRQLRAGVRGQWRKGKIRSTRTTQLPPASYGPLYFRKSYAIRGIQGGTARRGEVQLDYSLASGPTYCFARSESRVAPAKGYARAIRQLRSVQNSLAYFGPGVPGGGGNTDPDQ